MKNEHDFSGGERGKFYHPEAELRIPVYLDAENLSFVEKLAAERQQDLTTIVNEIVASDRSTSTDQR